jgi:DASS family divalent anion:Na+ symporter
MEPHVNSMDNEPNSMDNEPHINSMDKSSLRPNLPILYLLLLSLIWFIPPPLDLSPSAMPVLAVFLTVIGALLLTKYPIGIVTTLGLLTLVLSRNMKCWDQGVLVDCYNCVKCNGFKGAFDSLLSGFSSQVGWLVFSAFHLGAAVQSSGLGKRASVWFLRRLGKSALGLGYSLILSEVFLAPFIPSNTARGGGIVYPVVMSLIEGLDSLDNPNIAPYLVLCASHGNLLSSSMFLTASAPNSIIALALANQFHIQIDFVTWSLAALLPSILALVALPRIILAEYPVYYLPQSDSVSPNSPISPKEKKLCATMSLALLLFSTSKVTGLPDALISFCILFINIIIGVVEWNDIIKNSQAWDCFYWLAGMLTLADQLSIFGISKYVGQICGDLIISITDNVVIATCLLGLIYFVSMFLFSSVTAHATALGFPFISAGATIKSPPMLLFAILASFTTLSACLVK